MLRAIIFDMDGVLVNSGGCIRKTFNILLKDSGIQLSHEEFKRYHGMSLRDKLRLWREEYGIKEYNLEEFSRKAGEIELEMMSKELKPNPAVHKLIGDLKNKGLKVAVATSSLMWRAELILKLLEIKQSLDAIVAADDVEKHKPEPDLFLEAANRLGVKPEECVVVEDATNGIEAAKRANMKVVGVVTNFHPADELKEADLVVNNISELSIEKLEEL